MNRENHRGPSAKHPYFLFLTALGLTILNASPVLAHHQDKIPDKSVQLVSQFDETCTILGDSNHNYLQQTYEFLGNKEFLEAAKKSGVNCIAIEWPNAYQSLVDHLADDPKDVGLTSDYFGNPQDNFVSALWSTTKLVFKNENLKNVYGAMENMIKNCAQLNIKVVCADRETLMNYPKLSWLDKEVCCSELRMSPCNITDPRILDYLKYRDSPAGNQSMIDTVVQTMGQKLEKFIILVGSAHCDALQSDLTKEGIGSRIIDLHYDQAAYNNDLEIDESQSVQDFKTDTQFLMREKTSFTYWPNSRVTVTQVLNASYPKVSTLMP